MSRSENSDDVDKVSESLTSFRFALFGMVGLSIFWREFIEA